MEKNYHVQSLLGLHAQKLREVEEQKKEFSAAQIYPNNPSLLDLHEAKLAEIEARKKKRQKNKDRFFI